MKTYHNLNNYIHWHSILESFTPDVFTLLDNNNDNYTLAWGSDTVCVQEQFSNTKLRDFQRANQNEFLFGYLGFDAKNVFFNGIESKNQDQTQLNESVFFIPEHVIINKNSHLLYFGTEQGLNQINTLKEKISEPLSASNSHQDKLEADTSESEYLKKVELIKQNIQQGNIYEMNYCINFSKQKQLDIIQTFNNIKTNTKAPFSSLFKFKDTVIISGSPERFFLKQNSTIFSQPIKGTAARGNTPEMDSVLKTELLGNQKEISENVMIVDLVRNDLSKIADKQSVIVTELCKLYSFETVHQLISTVKANISADCDFESILAALFPMGSMTGAPKLSALTLIEDFESFKRNIYSGTIGYISPNKNMDFNVVIRSVVYNVLKELVNVSVGSAITINSDAKKEYDECLLKLDSIQKSLA